MEIPRHWRLRKWRYCLGAEVDSDGIVTNEVPVGVRNFIESEIKVSENSLAVDSQIVQALQLWVESLTE